MAKKQEKPVSKVRAEDVSFEVFYNALSVGWHLRKIAEADPQFMAGDEKWKKFTGWCDRHALKKDKFD